MEGSKIKNIILLILLCANLFLLALVGSRVWSAARYQSNARADAIEILARNGIAVEKTILPKDLSLSLYSVSRDREKEAALLVPLLGPVTEQSLGGGRYHYTGEKGEADFRSREKFSITLKPGLFPAGASVEDHAVETLALIGVESTVWSFRSEEDDAVVTLVQQWAGMPVFTCMMEATYVDGSLVSLSGTHLTGTPVPSDERELSAVTGLLRFLEQLSDTGDICNVVLEIVPGYQLSASLSAPATLTPVWYLKTDTGSYLLDIAAAELRRM